MGLGSLFQARDMKLQIKYNFWLNSLVRKLFCPARPFKKPEEGQTLKPLCKLGAYPTQENRLFLESAWKTLSIKSVYKKL